MVWDISCFRIGHFFYYQLVFGQGSAKCSSHGVARYSVDRTNYHYVCDSVCEFQKSHRSAGSKVADYISSKYTL